MPTSSITGRRFTTNRVGAYYWRQRRSSLWDPADGLFRTHDYVTADSGFDVGAAFPSRDLPITVAVWVRRDAATAQGIVFEMGDATTGLAIWIPGGGGGDNIQACAGGVGDDGVTLTATNSLNADGTVARVVFSVIPGNGEARLWINGRLVAAGVAVNGQMLNGWGADDPGGVGDVATAVSARVPIGDRIILTDASIVSPVSVYQNQRPRQFGAGLVGVVVVVGEALLIEAGDYLLTEAGDKILLG